MLYEKDPFILQTTDHRRMIGWGWITTDIYWHAFK